MLHFEAHLLEDICPSLPYFPAKPGDIIEQDVEYWWAKATNCAVHELRGMGVVKPSSVGDYIPELFAAVDWRLTEDEHAAKHIARKAEYVAKKIKFNKLTKVYEKKMRSSIKRHIEVMKTAMRSLVWSVIMTSLGQAFKSGARLVKSGDVPAFLKVIDARLCASQLLPPVAINMVANLILPPVAINMIADSKIKSSKTACRRPASDDAADLPMFKRRARKCAVVKIRVDETCGVASEALVGYVQMKGRAGACAPCGMQGGPSVDTSSKTAVDVGVQPIKDGARFVEGVAYLQDFPVIDAGANAVKPASKIILCVDENSETAMEEDVWDGPCIDSSSYAAVDVGNRPTYDDEKIVQGVCHRDIILGTSVVRSNNDWIIDDEVVIRDVERDLAMRAVQCVCCKEMRYSSPECLCVACVGSARDCVEHAKSVVSVPSVNGARNSVSKIAKKLVDLPANVEVLGCRAMIPNMKFESEVGSLSSGSVTEIFGHKSANCFNFCVGVPSLCMDSARKDSNVCGTVVLVITSTPTLQESAQCVDILPCCELDEVDSSILENVQSDSKIFTEELFECGQVRTIGEERTNVRCEQENLIVGSTIIMSESAQCVDTVLGRVFDGVESFVSAGPLCYPEVFAGELVLHEGSTPIYQPPVPISVECGGIIFARNLFEVTQDFQCCVSGGVTLAVMCPRGITRVPRLVRV